MRKLFVILFSGFILAWSVSGLKAQKSNGEAIQDVLAAQIRLQGFACDKALKATRDSKRSMPDRSVWVLKCSNAMYRFTRAPDMAAQIKQLR